jgi:hypothetical protein
MPIDRRQLLAGLGATPALPALANPPADVPPFPDYAAPDYAPLTIERWSIWHVQTATSSGLIRHLASGMTLCSYLPTDTTFCTHEYSDDWPFDKASWWPTFEVTYYALHRALAYLKKWPVHKGAIYFRYSFSKPGFPYAEPIVQNAPDISGIPQVFLT